MPARRAWRIQLTSCSLNSLEYHMLNVQRTQQDIPGFLIPQLYLDYLRTRNPAELQRVMYHNLHDVLSMASARDAAVPGRRRAYQCGGVYFGGAVSREHGAVRRGCGRLPGCAEGRCEPHQPDQPPRVVPVGPLPEAPFAP